MLLKNGLTISEWKVVFEALVDYADREDVKAAKFFACAERPDLKQEFTQEELDIIANRNQFKGVGWLQDLIRHAEPVEDD